MHRGGIDARTAGEPLGVIRFARVSRKPLETASVLYASLSVCRMEDEPGREMDWRIAVDE